METIIAWRNAVIAFLYQNLLKRIFFLYEPQKVHDRMVIAGNFFGRSSWGRGLFRLFFDYNNPKLRQTLAGLEFKNPVGLAAGFDKEAMLPSLLPAMGFGFEEVGSITFQPYAGNVGKWMWRLPEAKSLRINYGLKNSGANNIHSRLSGKKFNFILGISIAKTNSSLTSVVEQGIDDYLQSYRIFQNTGDYFTINISCPNTSEPSPIFAEPENLDLLLQKLFSIPKTKPVFIKLSPDLTEEKLNGILALGNTYPVDGFICTNLTKVNKFNHEGKGGFSGKAVEELSNQMLAKVYKYYGGKKIVIGCGGIFSAEDAYKKIKLGASLVQLITGMIYQGPQLVSQINLGLVKLLERDGYANICEAVGKGV
jgi:dihydroorotate dehydrogenase